MSHARTDRMEASWIETVDRLRTFIAGRVGNAEVAADITQDVLMRSFASGALDHVDNPTAWLYRSARNAVIDHYRTRRVHEAFDGDGVWPDLGELDDEPNDATRELSRCLQPMMDQLSDTAREALARVDLEGQTHQQVAAQLGLSVSGMKSRVQRARRQLRDVLQQCCTVGTDRTGAVTSFQPTEQGKCGGGAASSPCGT